MKLLLLLLISVCALQTGYTQTVQNQARQVITLQLMPVNVIELPTASDLLKKDQSANKSTGHTIHNKWFIDKQSPAFTAETPQANVFANNSATRQTTSALKNDGIAYPVIYTVTSL